MLFRTYLNYKLIIHLYNITLSILTPDFRRLTLKYNLFVACGVIFELFFLENLFDNVFANEMIIINFGVFCPIYNIYVLELLVSNLKSLTDCLFAFSIFTSHWNNYLVVK